MKSIFSEHLHFGIGYLLGFLYLSRVQLYLSSINSSSSGASHNIILNNLITWIHITILIIIDFLLIVLAVASLSVLLSDSAFELGDGTLLQLLSHHFFFTEP